MENMILVDLVTSVATNKQNAARSFPVRQHCVDNSKAHWIAPLKIIKHHQYWDGGSGEYPHEVFDDVTQTEEVDISFGALNYWERICSGGRRSQPDDTWQNISEHVNAWAKLHDNLMP